MNEFEQPGLKVQIKPLNTPMIKPAGGLTFRSPINDVPLTSARRTYENYPNLTNDWDRIAALKSMSVDTRNADQFVINYLKGRIGEHIKNNAQHFPQYKCLTCLKATLNNDHIRGTFFPDLKIKRESANKVVHAHDEKQSTEIAWSAAEVFDYFYYLYHQEDFIYGDIKLNLASLNKIMCTGCK